MGRLARPGAAFTAAVGIAVLCGWTWDVQALKTVWPGLASMKVSTAASFVLIGASLWLSTTNPIALWHRTVAAAMAAAVTTVAGAALYEYASGRDVGSDLAWINPEHLANSGRMAIATAAALLLLGASLLLRTRRDSLSRALVPWLTLPVTAIAIVAAVGYLFDVPSLYSITIYSSMAIHTAIVLWVATVSILSAQEEFLAIFWADSLGGQWMRRTLLGIVPLLVVIGRVVLAGADRGWYDLRFGMAIAAVLGAGSTGLILLMATRWLHVTDVARARAEADLRLLNLDLEVRIQERTLETRQAFERMAKLEGALPVCAWCKKVHGGENVWLPLDTYILQNTTQTHGMCPGCAAKFT